MRSSNANSSARDRRAGRAVWIVVLVTAAAGSSLLAAGCGGGSSGAGVAQIDTGTTSTSSPSSSSGSGKADPAAYSACMRKNGVPNFPDPDSNGNIKITGGQRSSGRKFGLDSNSPQFKRAQKSCQKLAPNGGKPDPRQHAKMQQQALKFAQCMRSHGVPKFPDPKFEPNGGMQVKVGEGVNPNSPQFKAAQKACQKLVPGSPLTTPPTGKP